jgi:hypothetical protein
MQRYKVCMLVCLFVSDGGCAWCEVNVESYGGEYVNKCVMVCVCVRHLHIDVGGWAGWCVCVCVCVCVCMGCVRVTACQN